MAPQLILKDDGILFENVDMSCGIIAHTTKSLVVAEAKRLGLPARSVQRGYYSLFKFWFIGQQQGDAFRVWRKNGEWVDFPFDHSIITF
jgi:hypothetical protein